MHFCIYSFLICFGAASCYAAQVGHELIALLPLYMSAADDRCELGAGFQNRAHTSGWVNVEGLGHNGVSGFEAGTGGSIRSQD